MVREASSGRLGLRSFGFGVGAMVILGGVALATDEAFVFPSLGPTAFLLVAEPLLPTACPRNTILGHLVGVLAGYLALLAFGLTDNPSAFAAGGDGITAARVGAAALALGVTSGVMVWWRVVHPPAGATTLIVALGVLRAPSELAVLMLAVAVLLLLGSVLNRTTGVPYPVWGASSAAPPTTPPGAP